MHQTFETYWYHRIWGRMKSWLEAAWFSKTEPPAGSRWRSLGRTRRCQEISSHSILLATLFQSVVSLSRTQWFHMISKRIQQWIRQHMEATMKWPESASSTDEAHLYQHFRLQHAPRSKMSTNYWRFNTEKQIRRPALPNKRYQVSDQQWRCWTRSQSGRPLPGTHNYSERERKQIGF